MKRTSLFSTLAVLSSLAWASSTQAQTRSWSVLTTGNGHGFQVFDRGNGRITEFLEHPYRHVAEGSDDRKSQVIRRDLAHDIYFGVRVDGTSRWVNQCGDGSQCTGLSEMGYEDETHIIKSQASLAGVALEFYFFAPFGYEGNGMVMLLRARNDSASTKQISIFAKPNLKLGSPTSEDRRSDPGDGGEQMRWVDSGGLAHGEETGPGGGHAIYIPIGDVSAVSCGTDSSLYNAVLGGGAIGAQRWTLVIVVAMSVVRVGSGGGGLVVPQRLPISMAVS